MVKNDFDIDVKVKCLEERVTQAQLAEMVGTSTPWFIKSYRTLHEVIRLWE